MKIVFDYFSVSLSLSVSTKTCLYENLREQLFKTDCTKLLISLEF
jgi:hypothetical protein